MLVHERPGWPTLGPSGKKGTLRVSAVLTSRQGLQAPLSRQLAGAACVFTPLVTQPTGRAWHLQMCGRKVGLAPSLPSLSPDVAESETSMTGLSKHTRISLTETDGSYLP